MKYKQLTVVTNSEYADIISLDMIEAGSEGTSVTDAADVRDVLKNETFWDYCDETLLREDPRVIVRGFFAEDAGLSALQARIDGYGGAAGPPEQSVSLLDSADYENEWKKYYRPIELGRLVVVPKWLRYDGNLTEVRIDPGMAFGTGSHETTAMCLELMQKFDFSGKSVYDVGCGSGILGIAAAKLGAGRVVMADIDENAVRAAKENAALNNIDCAILQGDLLTGQTQPADIILANITADVLLRLKKSLKPLLKPCGILILSGIINERAADIRAAFSDMTPAGHLQRGEWQAFAYSA